MNSKNINFNLIAFFKFKKIFSSAARFIYYPNLAENAKNLIQFNPCMFDNINSSRKEFGQNLNTIFCFLHQCKKNVFSFDLSLSRFTTVKYRVVDRRFRKPRLTEFSFNLESNVVQTWGLEKAKLSIDLYINSFNFIKHTMPLFLRTHNSIKLKPWQKTYSLLLRKISVKHFGFNASIFSPSSFLLASLFLIRYFFLAKDFYLNTKFKISSSELKNKEKGCFIFFKKRIQKLLGGSETGLIVFRNPKTSLLTLDESRVKFAKTWSVKDYGEYYPFSVKEIEVSGANRLLNDKQKGKATFFILETQRMLKRRARVFSLFLSKNANRVYPSAPFRQNTFLSSNLVEKFFIKSIDGKYCFDLIKKP